MKLNFNLKGGEINILVEFFGVKMWFDEIDLAFNFTAIFNDRDFRAGVSNSNWLEGNIPKK